jgi:hypothetical protein
MRRASITFFALLVFQLAGVLCVCYNSASGADLIRSVYWPFFFLVWPIERAQSGGAAGASGTLFIAMALAGAIAYAAVVGLLAASPWRARK